MCPKSACKSGAHRIPSSPSWRRGINPLRCNRSSSTTVSTISIAHIARRAATISPTGVHTYRQYDGGGSTGAVMA